MAREAKEALRTKIQQRRGEVLLSIGGTYITDALLARLFSNSETNADPARLITLSEKEKKEVTDNLAKMFKGPSDSLLYQMAKDGIDIMNGQPGRKWVFDIKPHQFIRYCVYAPLAFTILLMGNMVIKPLYGILRPANDTMQNLEAMDQRESYLHSIPLRMMLLMLVMSLELMTDIKIPKMFFLILLSGAAFCAKEGAYAAFSGDHDIFIENTSFYENQSVFFKVPKSYTDNPENLPLRNLMLNGERGTGKGNGFFEHGAARRGYDLKARVGDNKRAYFTKEVDGHGDATYHLLKDKPKRPGKMA